MIDFTNNTARMAFTYHGVPGLDGTTMTMVCVGRTFYLSMPQIGTILPGKSWVDATTGGASVAPGSSNPAAMFQVLQAQGDVVTPLGASVVNGESVHGYHVVIAAAAMQKAIAEAKIPADIAQEAQGMFGSGNITMDVYVGDANGMLARMVMGLQVTVAGQAVGATMTEDTSDFGVPVSVSAPPADQVASLQEFVQAAGSLGSSSGA